MWKRQWDALPGAELIREGLCDADAGRESIPALIVSIGASRLARCGIVVSRPLSKPEPRLYELLEKEHGDGAHSKYNALLRRLVSFERSVESA
jgi:hypothetical protein